jgi:RNA polymerase sigma-70 factor (ECF subfamily)
MDGTDYKEGSLPAAAARAVEAITPAGELGEIFQAHHARVFRAAFRITWNAADAEDILGTVFLRLVRQSGPIEHLESYLHRAAVNAALDVVRARRERGNIPLDVVAPVLAEAAHLEPDRQLETQELRDRLRQAIARLSPRAGEIFVLRYLEGYGNRDIARLLGVSQIRVGVSLHRSRRQLQGDLRSFQGARP